MATTNDLCSLFDHVTIQLWEERNVEEHGYDEEEVEAETKVEPIR